MALVDWYEIIVKQSSVAENAVNAYHVQRLNPAFLASNIAQAFEDWVLPSILLLQPTTITTDLIDVRNLGNPLDFHSQAPVLNTGTHTGVSLSTFVCATIQFNRLRTDMKNGQKRFLAGDESSVNGNLWNAAFVTLMDGIGAKMVSNWEEAAAPGVSVCSFGIIKRVCKDGEDPPCTSGYRLPENDSELVFYTPTTYVSRDTVRSQVSRKRLV